MNLYKKPPQSLLIDGEEYAIDTDFRVWVNIFCALSGGKTQEEKAQALGELLVSQRLPLTEESVNAVIDFFSCGSMGQSGKESNDKPCFDFVKDSEYIYSAFLDVYGIDLTTKPLHWWEFMALFRSLPDDCQMCKIIHYRAVKIDDVPKSQKAFYREMKLRYALDVCKKPKTAAEHEEEMKRKVDELYKQAKSKMSAMRSGEQSSND